MIKAQALREQIQYRDNSDFSSIIKEIEDKLTQSAKLGISSISYWREVLTRSALKELITSELVSNGYKVTYHQGDYRDDPYLSIEF